jgi:predicted anti-sigma-YlaC factor YlaD
MTHLGHRVAGFLDGELPAASAELVAAHLVLCSACRAAAADQSQVKSDLRRLTEPAPSNDLVASLLRLPGPDGPVGFGRPSARPRRPAAPLVAAGLAGVAALTMASTVFTGAAVQRAHHTVRPAPAGTRVGRVPLVVDAGAVRTPEATSSADDPLVPRSFPAPIVVQVQMVRGMR